MTGWALRRVTVISSSAFAALVVPSAGHATLYECLDPSGITVITDSPSQLLHCQIIVESHAEQRDHASPRVPMPPLPPAAPASEKPAPPVEPVPLIAKTDRAPSIAVPLQHIGSLFVVSITVNGSRDARVILDTGASHTVLSRSIARDADLYSDARSTSVTMQTVGGQVQGDIIHVESIRVADAEVKSSHAVIYDLPDAPPGVEGLLGLSFLRQFEVTLNAARNQLYLGRVAP